MPAPKTITIVEIIKLFKRQLGVGIGRTHIYHQQRKHAFPKSLGLGRPVRWNEALVLAWFKKRKKDLGTQ